MTTPEIIKWLIDAHVMIGTNNNEGKDEGKQLLGALIDMLKKEGKKDIQKEHLQGLIEKTNSLALQVAKYQHVSEGCARKEYLSGITFQNNRVSIRFEGYNRGMWEEFVELTIDDLFDEPEKVVQKYKDGYDKYKAEQEKSQREAEKLKQESEKKEYLRLKEIYGKDNNDNTSSQERS